MTVAGHQIQPSSCVSNLGVTFDCNLRMEQQIANIVKVCYYQIRNIGRIRPHLTNVSCKTLVHALVTWQLSPLWSTKQHHAATAKGAELCSSYNYAYEEIRSYFTRVAAITLPTSSSETNIQSAAIYLLCSELGSARLPEWIVQLQTRKQNSTICFSGRPFCPYPPHRPTVITVSPSARQCYGTICRLWSGLPQQ